MGDSPKTEMLDFLRIPQSVKPREFKLLVLCEETKHDSICPGFVSSPLGYHMDSMCTREQFESKELFTTSPRSKGGEGADPKLRS